LEHLERSKLTRWAPVCGIAGITRPHGDQPQSTFGEIDETGKAKLAAFAADHGGLQFEYMPIEGRLYFMRKAAG
jgi:hypothetical protein